MLRSLVSCGKLKLHPGSFRRRLATEANNSPLIPPPPPESCKPYTILLFQLQIIFYELWWFLGQLRYLRYYFVGFCSVITVYLTISATKAYYQQRKEIANASQTVDSSTKKEETKNFSLGCHQNNFSLLLHICARYHRNIFLQLLNRQIIIIT